MTDPYEKKPFLSFYEHLSENQELSHKKNGHAYPPLEEDPEQEATEMEEDYTYLLTEGIDHDILMHRDAHFGGDFGVMLDYYHKNGQGTLPMIPIERIAQLADLEKEIGQDLAPLILTAAEAEAVGKARRTYMQLKEIYEIENEKTPIPRLIADLILSEESSPEAEIEAIVSQGTQSVPALIELIQADKFYETLSPGYGRAPRLAIFCLAQIKDQRAIIPLFEALSRQDFFNELGIVEALTAIGTHAKYFLLQVVQNRPITDENSDAAFVLIQFAYDSLVAITCFEQLKDPEVQAKPLLYNYLLSSCYQLKGTDYQKEFEQLADDPNLPKGMRTEMQRILKQWNVRR